MHVQALYTGKAKQVNWHGQELLTALEKELSHDALHLSTLNLQGDEQGNTVHHGGIDKAACVYAAEHYPYWEEKLGWRLPVSAFGENFTVVNLTEDKAHIGDIFRWGKAVVQISQPRQPCFKLAARYGEKQLPSFLMNTGFTGFYLRVLEEGEVAPGSEITLLTADEHKITVAEANRIMYHDTDSTEAVQKLLQSESLAEAWRTPLKKRLKNLQQKEA